MLIKAEADLLHQTHLRPEDGKRTNEAIRRQAGATIVGGAPSLCGSVPVFKLKQCVRLVL